MSETHLLHVEHRANNPHLERVHHPLQRGVLHLEEEDCSVGGQLVAQPGLALAADHGGEVLVGAVDNPGDVVEWVIQLTPPWPVRVYTLIIFLWLRLFS